MAGFNYSRQHNLQEEAFKGKKINYKKFKGEYLRRIWLNPKWKEYEFKAKPGNPYRSLPIIAPYQPRVDWQIWFAAMESPQQNPWLIHMIWKLLDNDKDTLSLIANNPFRDKPPKYIRVEFYRYQFAEIGNKEGKVWNRNYIVEWLPPLSKSTNGFKEYIQANGWKN